jgi:hypothetical protein
MTPPRLPSFALSTLCAVAGLALLGCPNNGSTPPPAFGGAAPLSITCNTGTGSALIGSSPIDVFARVSRGGNGAAGETVVFSVNRGTMSPTQAVTDSLGIATSFFRPPSTAGTATLTMTVIDRITGDVWTSTCTIAVTAPRDPELTVQLITPSQAAGVNVRVVYNASRVSLPAGGAVALTPFTSSSCVSIAGNDGSGVATLNMACTLLQQTFGPIARFSFVHVSGPELDPADFAIECIAFDVRGVAVSAACSGTVLQL